MMPSVTRLLVPLIVAASSLSSPAQDSTTPLPPGFPPTKRPEEIRFKHPSFTFARIKYSGPPRAGFRARSSGWATDYPDADLNLSARVQQVTGLRSDPNGKVVELTDTNLKQYPFVYLVEPGNLHLQAAEAQSLRDYLLGGGFLMMDDFWGVDEWANLAEQMRAVFPDRQMFDVPRTHPIFHCFFDISNDLNLQVPSIAYAMHGPANAVSWETNKRYDGDTAVHFRGYNDDKGRLCVIICHNTDLADAWEREGEHEFYFREFSLKKAYPLGINIVVYALSH